MAATKSGKSVRVDGSVSSRRAALLEHRTMLLKSAQEAAGAKSYTAVVSANKAVGEIDRELHRLAAVERIAKLPALPDRLRASASLALAEGSYTAAGSLEASALEEETREREAAEARERDEAAAAAARMRDPMQAMERLSDMLSTLPDLALVRLLANVARRNPNALREALAHATPLISSSEVQ